MKVLNSYNEKAKKTGTVAENDAVSVFLLLFDQCGNLSESRMHGCFHQFKENCFVDGNNGTGLRHPAESSLKIRGFSGRDAVCNQKNLVTQM